MQPAEKSRLFVEASMLRQYLAGKGKGHYFEQGSNGRVKKRSAQYDPDSLAYLMQYAWGLGNS